MALIFQAATQNAFFEMRTKERTFYRLRKTKPRTGQNLYL